MEHDKPTDAPEPPKLLEVLQSLDSHIQRQNSLKYAFVRGMVYGLGTVIGATVLVALLGSVFVSVLNTFSDVPLGENSLQTPLSPDRF